VTPNGKCVQNPANPTTKAEERWGQLSPRESVWLWKFDYDSRSEEITVGHGSCTPD
jgi:hypothetical protein